MTSSFLQKMTPIAIAIASMLTSKDSMASKEQSLKLLIDKGTLKVQLVDGLGTPTAEVLSSVNCAAAPKVRVKDGAITIIHSVDPCPTGAVVEVKVPTGLSFTVQHGGGVIEVKGLSEAIDHYDGIYAQTSGGLIQTELNEIKVSGFTAPATAKYERASGTSPQGAKIRINLLGGVIQFQN
jgi:hypothetical protein